MNIIPIIVAKFLALPETEDFNIYDKFAYLVKSKDGDDYYLRTALQEDGVLTEELGNDLYELIADDVSYEDIFTWYVNWTS